MINYDKNVLYYEYLRLKVSIIENLINFKLHLYLWIMIIILHTLAVIHWIERIHFIMRALSFNDCHSFIDSSYFQTHFHSRNEFR